MQSNVVLSGQVKQYFACESQHQHGAFNDMTAELEILKYTPVIKHSWLENPYFQ